MRTSGLLVTMAMVALVAVLAPTPAYGALKVGMVDIVAVTNGYDRTKDASSDLQIELANLKAASEPKAKALEDLRLKRDGFNKGTKEWKDLDDQVLKVDVELRNWLAIERIKVERRHRDVLLDMYREITKVVERLAKQKGFDLVYTKAFLEPPQIDVDTAQGLDDLKNRILQQRVLYPADVEDLTQDVLKILNSEYKANKGAGGARG